MAGKNALVKAQTLKGFQDFLPADVLVRSAVMRRIEGIFQTYGFSPVETPALEYLDVLLGAGGEETNKELFRLESPEVEPIAPLRSNRALRAAAGAVSRADQGALPPLCHGAGVAGG